MSESQSFDLRDYAQSRDSIPKFHVFWRVTHGGSQSRRDSKTGELRAAASDLLIDNEERLKRAVANHIQWSCREKSPFLSVFSDEEHARRWAKYCDPPVYITQVITSRLPSDVYYFSAPTLCRRLHIIHEYGRNEVFILHRIPWQALGRMRDLDGNPKDSGTNSMIKLIGEANDTFAKYIAITEDSSIAYAIRNLAGDMEEHHQAQVRAMAEVIIDDTQEGREPDNEADSSTQNPFSKVYQLLRPPPRPRESIPLRIPVSLSDDDDEPLDNQSSLEAAQDEIAKNPGSQPMEQHEGVGKQTAAVASSPAEEPGIPDVGRLTLPEGSFV
ncbi:hypothetical protein N656DRAFT_644156 [Canariomyces notabilis]|uniref:DUF7587 domain-containing protein n=1 Tax=Canariomyces notabilis TaxID=2074819 RepID=A0AAN6YSW3_9PEZI|nr:hypothetical protein N656DRAFT_644156 [Canariomyces arenarius]